MTPPPLREAARVIVLDDDHWVLLLRYDEGGSLWATPAAWRRVRATPRPRSASLHEELGVDEKKVELGGQLA
jgi:hypothetical protein